MKLITKSLNIPDLYAQDGMGGKSRVYAKLFDIMSQARWYITEYSEAENLAFGFVNLYGDVNDGCAELGYISMAEITDMNKRFPRIERDTSWDNKTTLDDVMSGKVV